MIKATEGRVRSLSRDEAEWVVRVRRARPDLHPWLAYKYATRYRARDDRGESTEGLDIQLAVFFRGDPEAERFAFIPEGMHVVVTEDEDDGT
ncbi:MAG: hypothetical protein ABR509_04925 [Candidatus Limnocylindria bacterium]